MSDDREIILHLLDGLSSAAIIADIITNAICSLDILLSGSQDLYMPVIIFSNSASSELVCDGAAWRLFRQEFSST